MLFIILKLISLSSGKTGYDTIFSYLSDCRTHFLFGWLGQYCSVDSIDKDLTNFWHHVGICQLAGSWDHH